MQIRVNNFYQGCIYLIVSTSLLVVVLNIFKYLFIITPLSIFVAAIGMILSIPFSKIYIYLYKKNLINILKNKKTYLVIHFLLWLITFIFVYLTKNTDIYYGFVNIDSFIQGYYDGQYSTFEFITTPIITITWFLAAPFFLIISPLSFIIHDEKFAKIWFFSLCFIISIPTLTIPFLWIPMIVYYPLMRKYTTKVRKRIKRL